MDAVAGSTPDQGSLHQRLYSLCCWMIEVGLRSYTVLLCTSSTRVGDRYGLILGYFAQTALENSMSLKFSPSPLPIFVYKIAHLYQCIALYELVRMHCIDFFIPYRGFSPKPPGGWDFFSVIWVNASIKKNPPPGGFREFRDVVHGSNIQVGEVLVLRNQH